MRVLVLPDIHYRRQTGGEDRRTLAAVKRYVADHQWDKVVLLGDVMDHNSISRHNQANLRAVKDETLYRDYEHANLDLDEFAQAWGATTPVALIEGNHDWRPEAVIDAMPQLAGKIETRIGLQVAERGWTWVPFWSKGTDYRIGKATFIHGLYTNDHHAKKHAQAFGRNIFYGHLHDVQAYSLQRIGEAGIVAQSMGCLCDYRQFYMRGRPHRWQQAFGVFHFMPNGRFTYFLPRLFNHRFTSPEGKFYKP